MNGLGFNPLKYGILMHMHVFCIFVFALVQCSRNIIMIFVIIIVVVIISIITIIIIVVVVVVVVAAAIICLALRDQS